MYLKSVENVITLGKLIGLLFLFCLPLLSILFLKTKRNGLARPVMGTIFLVYGHIHVNKEFWQQFQNYAPPSLRVIRTKFAHTIYIIGERAKRARHSQVCSIENRGYMCDRL